MRSSRRPPRFWWISSAALNTVSASVSSPCTCSALARGDHEPESDVDVAVVLDQEMPRPFEVTREILEDTYDLLLDTGYYIQPWPLEKGSLDDPLSHPYPQISRAVLRDGIRVA